ncbi:MAG: NUDIX domain-containing protein, partial [Salinivenus sp.]
LARAVIRRGDHVLFVRADGHAHTFLPGGHVEDGEGLTGCLRRELREELGVESRVGRYLGAVEHQWRRNDTPQYEINHCFAVDVPALDAATDPPAQEAYLSFEWARRDALEEAALQPPPLRHLLADPEAHAPWWASTLNSPASVDPDGTGT